MRMVEDARIEHLATSGAVSGGTTAEFLRSQAPEDQARALLDSLEAKPMEVESSPAAEENAPDETPSIVDELMKQQEPASRIKASPSQGTQPDSSMIEGLLDQGDDDGAESGS
jgi:hypothetical protein